MSVCVCANACVSMCVHECECVSKCVNVGGVSVGGVCTCHTQVTVSPLPEVQPVLLTRQ